MPANDRPDGRERDPYDEAAPRSIFATTWFRGLLVLIVLAVAVAIAAPYILDATNPLSKFTTASRPAPAPTAAKPAPPAPPSTAMSTQADKPADKPLTPDATPADKPAATPMTPRKPLAGDKTALADKPDKAVATAKSTDTLAAIDKAVADKKDTAATKVAAARSTGAASAPRAATGGWWVQVGAFRDENKAHNLAAKLRQENYNVEQSLRRGGSSVTKSAVADKSAPAASTSGPVGADQYDVFVSGLSVDELNTRLAAKSLAAEPSGAGAVIKPSLPLREAVALSKDLAMEGLKVQVRRAAGTSTPVARAPEKRPAPTVRGGELYRVRVGGFPDKATAMSTLKELEAKGYKPFIARGGP